MNPEKIGPLYEELSDHFEVPMLEWEVLPKPKISKKQVNQIVSENNQLPLGRFLAKMEKKLPLGVIITNIEEEDDIDFEKKTRIIARNLELISYTARFIEDPTPRIVFLGVPTLKTVMHEFMHYLVYCVRKEKKE